jgi:hypothetical protein
MSDQAVHNLIRDLKFIAEMVSVAHKAGDKQSALRYLNSAGNLLNKISMELHK